MKSPRSSKKRSKRKGVARTPPHPNCAEVTMGKFRSSLISSIRNRSMWWPPISQARKDAFVRVGVNRNTGKKVQLYRCAECDGLFQQKEIMVDHIDPVIDPLVGFQGWDIYIDRMFCAKENLQVLCKQCHSKKIAEEKELKKSK